jgi:hypothetical protein
MADGNRANTISQICRTNAQKRPEEEVGAEVEGEEEEGEEEEEGSTWE